MEYQSVWEIIFVKEKELSIWFHIPNVNLDLTKENIFFQDPKLRNNLITNARVKRSTLSVKTSSSRSNEIFSKWQNFLQTNIFADKYLSPTSIFYRQIFFADETI